MRTTKFSATVTYTIFFEFYKIHLHGGAIDLSFSETRLLKKNVVTPKNQKDRYYEALLDMLLAKLEKCSFMETVESTASYGYISFDRSGEDSNEFNPSITFFLTNKHSQEFNLLLQNPLLKKELKFRVTDLELDEYKELIATQPDDPKIYLENMVSLTLTNIAN